MKATHQTGQYRNGYRLPVLMLLLLIPIANGVASEGMFYGAITSEKPDWFKESFLEFEEDVAEAIRRFTWEGCEAETILYVQDGGGHAWPGKPMPQFEEMFGPGTTAIDATDLMFAFFDPVAG